MTYHGQGGTDEHLHLTYFADRRDGVAIECGACDGILESNCLFFERELGWKVVNVEAAPPLYERLVRNRPSSVNINAALTRTSGEATFNHIVSPHHEVFGNGSLRHEGWHLSQLVRSGCHVEQYEVRTITFPELIAEAGVDHVDLLVLDVEGREIDALSGLRRSPVLPEVICVEHSIVGLPALKEALRDLYEVSSSIFVNTIFTRLK